MKRCLAAVALLALLATPALAKGESAVGHACGEAARVQAERLLRFHFEDDGSADVFIHEEVAELAPVAGLEGGAFDVLEVWGSIYRADYRMRLIYAQIPGSCLLMGQEILESSNPY